MELCTSVLCRPNCNFLLKGPFVKDPLVDSEILHGGEVRDVEWYLEARNKFFMFAFACVLLSIAYYFSCLCGYSYCILLLLLFHPSLSLLVYTHLNKEAIEHLNS